MGRYTLVATSEDAKGLTHRGGESGDLVLWETPRSILLGRGVRESEGFR
jgi:hypothetical protein